MPPDIRIRQPAAVIAIAKRPDSRVERLDFARARVLVGGDHAAGGWDSGPAEIGGVGAAEGGACGDAVGAVPGGAFLQGGTG